MDDSPAVSVQHSFGDHSNDSVPSDCAAGKLGLMTQTFKVPDESPPPMPSNISLTTGDEPSPTHYKGRGMFAKDRPQYEDHHDPPYNCPPAHRYKDRAGKPQRLSFGETLSYKPRYEERKPPPHYQECKPPPRYKERKPPPIYEECKPPPRYEERKPPPRYAERKPPARYEERKPPPRHSYKTEYKERKPPPHRHSYESRYKERKPPCPHSTSTPSYEQRPSLAERGSRQRSPPHQDQRRVSFGTNCYYQMEDYGAWGPTPVHRPSAWEGDVELPEWGLQIRW
eukprot:jgi/Psemu1/60348/gm1.60348_g